MGILPGMEKGELKVVASAMAALYLRGSPYARAIRRRNWVRVQDALCRAAPKLGQVAPALKDAGLWDEASALADGRALDWGNDQVEAGRVLTVVSAGYPARWIQVLGACAPPCAWIQGQCPVGPMVSVTGNRCLDSRDRSFARSLGAAVMSCGHCLVTGGAIGSDSVAALSALGAGGAGRVLFIIPCGLSAVQVPPGVVAISVCEPSASFSAGQAMERNTLIYAASERAVVVRARYREGGTWTGATDAVRRTLCELLVRRIAGDQASDALIRLGAVSVDTIEDVVARLKQPMAPAQRLWDG